MKYILLLIFFSLFAMKALFVPGYYTSHDGWHQVARLYYFEKSIEDGIFPPSYVSTVYNGFGYPLFIFNYQFPFFMASAFMNFGMSIFESIKSVYVIGYLFSAFSMYYYLRTQYSRISSFVGSLIYIWSPYRFSNIFVRGAFGEATLFMFIPLLLTSVDKLMEKFRWSYIALGAFSILGLILSHAIGALVVLFFVSIYALVNIFMMKKTKPLLYLLTLALFGILVSSYYLVPALVLKSITNFDLSIQSTAYDGQYAPLFQLLYSRWGYGFANSIFDKMSFQVGIINWVAVILSFLLIVKNYKHNLIKFRRPVSMIIIFAISIFMITPYSNIIWDNAINKVFFVDFHWRLLTVTVTVSSILAAFVISSFSKNLQIIAALFFIAICLYTNRNHIRVNQYTDIPLSLYLLSEVSTNTYDEYLPREANSKYAKDIKSGGKLEFGSQTIDPIIQKINYYRYGVNSEEDRNYIINLFYFPGWKVYLDGIQSPVERTNQGLMSVLVPKKTDYIDVVYNGVMIANVTKWVSALTLFTIIILCLI